VLKILSTGLGIIAVLKQIFAPNCPGCGRQVKELE